MLYDSKIRVVQTHDGDTTTLNIDIFIRRTFFEGPVRLLGINAPEIDDPNIDVKYRATLSKLYLAHLLGTQKKLKAEIKTDDKYGRPLSTIHVYDSKKKLWLNVNQIMLDKGYAVPISLSMQKKQDKLPHLTVTAKNFFPRK